MDIGLYTTAELRGYDAAVLVSAHGDVSPSSGGVCAWLADLNKGVNKRIVGGMSEAAIQLMDLMAIVAALQYHHERMRDSDREVRVCVITDNRELVKLAALGGDTMEWLLFDWFSRHGYLIDWHWESARTKGTEVDTQLAHNVRQAMKSMQCPATNALI